MEEIIVEGKAGGKASVPAILLVVAALVWFLGIGSSIDGPVVDAMWDHPVVILLPTALFLIAAVIAFLWMRSCKIVVTDKRVYGKAGFGTRVDLPLDMISSASTGIFKSVGVSTSSGKINFWCLDNNEEIFSAITKLLLERQQNTPEKKNDCTGTAEELREYKQLLDENIISQEEFEAKKKQLLNL